MVDKEKAESSDEQVENDLEEEARVQWEALDEYTIYANFCTG